MGEKNKISFQQFLELQEALKGSPWCLPAPLEKKGEDINPHPISGGKNVLSAFLVGSSISQVQGCFLGRKSVSTARPIWDARFSRAVLNRDLGKARLG